MPDLFIDYETYSGVDIKETSTLGYVTHPDFEVLLCAWAIDDEPVQVWQVPYEDAPERFVHALLDPGTNVWAFNAWFERHVTQHGLGYVVSPERWRDVMALAYAAGFTGGLDDVCKQMGLEADQAKLDGRRLIHRFCKPAPKNHKVRRYTRSTHPEEWARFVEYCQRDVESMREVHHRLEATIRPMERRHVA